MKVVVSKNALTGLVETLVNEDRSFHTKNVNELEKALPPIFPHEQMAQQLSQDKVPVDDPSFMPTNKSELGKAAMQLSDKVMDEKIGKFYNALKKIAAQSSPKPDPIKIQEQIDKVVSRILAEVEDPDVDLSDDDIDRLLNIKDESPAERAAEMIIDKISSLKPEEKKKIFLEPAPRELGKGSGEDLDIGQKYLRSVGEFVPRQDPEEIADMILGFASAKRTISDLGARPEEVRPFLLASLEGMVPNPYLSPESDPEDVEALIAAKRAERVPQGEKVRRGVLTPQVFRDVKAGKIVDMIYRDNSTDKTRFVEAIRDKRLELIQTGDRQDKRLADAVGLIAIKYLEKFKRGGEYVEVASEEEENLPSTPRAKVLKSPRQLAVYSDMIDALVDLRNSKPKEFIKLMNGIGKINVEGKGYDLASFTLDDFDFLPDDEKAAIFRYLAINADKQTWGPSYRWVQNLERTLGMKMLKDKDEFLPSYEVPEVEPGVFKVQALPWKALPDDFVEIFYDTCVFEPIKRGMVNQYNVSFQQFMQSLSGDEKLEMRRVVKDVLYRTLLNNRDKFADELEIWYTIHDNKQLKDTILDTYKEEVALINSSGFTVSNTEIDQYFTNISSTALDIYHLVNGLLYSIALKHMHELLVSSRGQTKTISDAERQKNINEIVEMLEAAYSNQNPLEISEFIKSLRKVVTRKFKVSYSDIFEVPWNQFYAKFKNQIIADINAKIDASMKTGSSLSPEQVTFFDDLVNLTKSEDKEEYEDLEEDEEISKTIGDEVENVKLGFADQLNDLIGASRSGKSMSYKTVPAAIGVYILKALKEFKSNVSGPAAQAVDAAITGLEGKETIKTVGAVTVQDPKGILRPKVKESTMAYILSRLLEQSRRPARR